jgi:hypothetical protein
MEALNAENALLREKLAAAGTAGAAGFSNETRLRSLWRPSWRRELAGPPSVIPQPET